MVLCILHRHQSQCGSRCCLYERLYLHIRLSNGYHACTLQDAVQAVVQFLWADNREVPLIAAYHKDAAGELLSMRREVSACVSSSGNCYDSRLWSGRWPTQHQPPVMSAHLAECVITARHNIRGEGMRRVPDGPTHFAVQDRPEWTLREEAQKRSDRQLPEMPEGIVQVLLVHNYGMLVIPCQHKGAVGAGLLTVSAVGACSVACWIAGEMMHTDRPRLQAKHRRVRRWEVLWGVHSASLKWRALQRRRETRAAVYRATLERAPQDDKPALEEALDSLLSAQSLEVYVLQWCQLSL